METILESFHERVNEIEEYLKLLQLISSPNTQIHSNGKRPKSVDIIALKTMKASCFLMFYNLVESSIRGSMSKLYEKMNSENHGLLEFDAFVKEIWIEQKFKSMEPISSNQNTYRKLIKSMVDDVLDLVPISLDSGKLPISGNLDARKIRKLFSKHNIPINTHYRAFNGAELKTIKDQRNSLAHGSVSFAECGQEYSVQMIIDIKREAVIYLRSLLKNVQKYIEKTKYAA